MRVEQPKRLKELEKENAQVKKLGADISLSTALLKEAATGIPLSGETQMIHLVGELTRVFFVTRIS
jgi:hypothetical protein